MARKKRNRRAGDAAAPKAIAEQQEVASNSPNRRAPQAPRLAWHGLPPAPVLEQGPPLTWVSHHLSGPAQAAWARLDIADPKKTVN